MVDFTALAEVFEGAGWNLAGFARLAPLVLATNGWEGKPGEPGRWKWIQDLLRLTSLEEAGELFRVMMCVKGKVPSWSGWTRCDESDRL